MEKKSGSIKSTHLLAFIGDLIFITAEYPIKLW